MADEKNQSTGSDEQQRQVVVDVNALLAEAQLESNPDYSYAGMEEYYSNDFANYPPQNEPPYSEQDVGITQQDIASSAPPSNLETPVNTNQEVLGQKEINMAENNAENIATLTAEEQHEQIIQTFKNVARSSVQLSELQKYTSASSSDLDDRLDEVGKFMNPSLENVDISNEQRYEVLSIATKQYLNDSLKEMKSGFSNDEISSYLTGADKDIVRLQSLIQDSLANNKQIDGLSFERKQSQYSFDNFSSLTNEEKGFLRNTVESLPPSLVRGVDDGLMSLKNQLPPNQFKLEDAYGYIVQKSSEYDNMVNNFFPENRSKANKNKINFSSVVNDIDNNSTRYLHDNNSKIELPNIIPTSPEEYEKSIKEKVDNINKQLKSFENNKTRPNLDAADKTELNLLLDKVSDIDYFSKNDVMMARIEDRLTKTNANLDALNTPEHMKVALLNHDLSQVGYSVAIEQMNNYNEQNPDAPQRTFGEEISKKYRDAQKEVNRNQYLDSNHAEPYTSAKNSPVSKIQGLSNAEGAIIDSSLYSLSHGARTHVYDELRKEFGEGDKASYQEVLSKVSSTLTDFDDMYKEVSASDLKGTRTSHQTFKKAVDLNVSRVSKNLDDSAGLNLKNRTSSAIKEGVDNSVKSQGGDIKNKDWGVPTNIKNDGSTSQNPEALNENPNPEQGNKTPNQNPNQNPSPNPEQESQNSDPEQENENPDPEQENQNANGIRLGLGGSNRRRNTQGNQANNNQANYNQANNNNNQGNNNSNGAGQPFQDHSVKYSLFNFSKGVAQPNPANNQQAQNLANTNPLTGGPTNGEACPPLEPCDVQALQAMQQQQQGSEHSLFNGYNLPPVQSEDLVTSQSNKPKVDFGNNSLNDSYQGLERQHKRMQDYFGSEGFETAQGYKMAEDYLKQANNFSKEVDAELNNNRHNADKVTAINEGLESVTKLNSDVESLVDSKNLKDPNLPENKNRMDKMKEGLGEGFDKMKESFSEIAEKARLIAEAITNAIRKILR